MYLLYTGLQITVGHRTMSDQIWQMSEQNEILIGHNVRPNKIYCLMKKFCFIMLKEKLLFLTKKAIRFPFVIQSTGWILTPAWLNRSSDTDADFSILLWLMPDNFTCQSARTLSDQGVKQSITYTRYDTAHFYSVQVV